MFVLSNFILASVHILNIVFQMMIWLIIIRALLSWVSPDPFNSIVQFITKITEPILYPIRRLPFSRIAGLDISPMIAILIIVFLQRWLIPTLTLWAYAVGG
jgi:YggT family protein